MCYDLSNNNSWLFYGNLGVWCIEMAFSAFLSKNQVKSPHGLSINMFSKSPFSIEISQLLHKIEYTHTCRKRGI
jgi:hypothetical protein